ncbi:prolyl oligopeptidase family serine peptidase [Bacillus sp. SM2101]|uniref:alpha/beta hydrolase family protein n=1 Tax=Bacillus sp. SM2101 TaxID=2805366 RepID=UPI001BDE6421|nr:prolyl oligopeptidase family serine peptidase [Bacillus sp. SM2101]
MKRSKVILLMFLVLSLAACSEAEKTIISLENENRPEGKLENTEVINLKYRSDGHEVTGYIIKPKENHKVSPVLIFNRGGNRDYGMIDINTINYLSGWAQKGYIVIASQYRGSISKEGQDEFGGSDVNDVMNLVNVAKELPYADTNNIFMLGMSRGGMMAYLAAKKDIQVKAIAVVGGITDLFDTYENRGEDMKSVLEDLVGNPLLDKQKYIDRSAIFWADEIKVPTLILHGEDDWRVSVKQANELANKLKEHNREYKFISYPKGDHVLNTHFEEVVDEIDVWFNEYLNE